MREREREYIYTYISRGRDDRDVKRYIEIDREINKGGDSEIRRRIEIKEANR